MKMTITIASTALICSIVVATSCAPLLRRPESEISATLLEKISLGSASREVREKLHSLGYNDIQEIVGRSAVPASPPFEQDGWTSFFRVHLGKYGWVVSTDVVAFFPFDQQGKLIGIHVKKFNEGT